MTAPVPPSPQPRRVARRSVGPRLRVLLVVVLVAFALLTANAVYLGLVTFLEWRTGETFQDLVYQYMFLFHLALGLAFVVPALVFMSLHLRNAWRRPNRRAVYAGLGLFSSVLVLLVSGLLLIRFDLFELRHPALRSAMYWSHVLVPLLCVWLFVLHRLAGPRIRWRAGLAVATVAAVFALGLAVVQAQNPHRWNRVGDVGETHFLPSLSRSASGKYIPPEALMNDAYCAECHADVHAQWQTSVHRFASFNNPVYRFSVMNTRKFMQERDGNLDAARWCAGCHDPVPLYAGTFVDPDFSTDDPTAHAGVTCTVCHAITHVNSVKGNAAYTLESPLHYPFATSDNAVLAWTNRQLIKAKPDFHKKTFLKPLHRSAEFCGTCHKVHLPEELNHYKWLRGQNHYDAFLLSGVSGHGVTSFYYPPKAQPNCNGCHMPLTASRDFGARDNDGSGTLSVHDHLFPAANTAIPGLVGMPDADAVAARHMAFLEGSMRVDIVALREDGRIDGALVGPLRPTVPALEPGREYLLEAVLRTMRLGHLFTQGTVDSNEVWVEVIAEHDGRVIGRSGGLDQADLGVDPWSHFVNVYMLDREGRRIDRRNPEEIFVPLYNHQIPPGAADVVHYRLAVPPDASGELAVTVRLHYRKFDTVLMRQVEGEEFTRNTLPVTTIAEDRMVFPIGKASGSAQKSAVASTSASAPDIPEWQRWNDYGIGLLLKPQRRQLRQAEEAFARVEALGHSAGALNLARVYLQEGRLDEAGDALARAAAHEAPPPPWSMAWFGGMLLKERGELDAALEAFTGLVETRYAEARERGFDFSRDYRLLEQLGLTWMEIAKRARGEQGRAQREAALREAQRWFEAALAGDPERDSTHYNLAQVHRQLGNADAARDHAALHSRYRPDDNARDRAIAAARQRDPAADHAADPVVIYDLHRDGAEVFALPVAKQPAGVAALAPCADAVRGPGTAATPCSGAGAAR